MNATSFEVTDKAFQKFRDLLYQESGIKLSEHKKPLLVSRLSKRLRRLELRSFEDYYDYVLGKGADEGEFVQMLDLLSTNKTDFFREPAHFKFLAEHILPALEDDKKIRIWSSACSSGEEPYTIAMTLNDAISRPEEWDCKILASDLSTRVLEKAAKGIYAGDRVTGIDLKALRRHFLKGKGENSDKVKVKKHLSDMVVFRRINLMNEDYPIKTPLDLIFCRNVMIYFDQPTQERLVNNFYRYLKPNGFLFIGHSESLQWAESPFVQVGPTIYQKREADAA